MGGEQENPDSPVMEPATMVYLGGSKKSFHCHCGCNVFQPEGSIFTCNACGEQYEAS